MCHHGQLEGCQKFSKTWEYVVLSRVRTLSGLYLIDPIDMESHLAHLLNSEPTLTNLKKEKYILDECKKSYVTNDMDITQFVYKKHNP